MLPVTSAPEPPPPDVGAAGPARDDAPRLPDDPSRPATPTRNTRARTGRGAADEFDGSAEERAAAEDAVRRVRGDFSSRSAFGDYTEFHGPGHIYRAENVNLHFGPGSVRGPRGAGTLGSRAEVFRRTFVPTRFRPPLVERLQAPRCQIQVLTGKPEAGRNSERASCSGRTDRYRVRPGVRARSADCLSLTCVPMNSSRTVATFSTPLAASNPTVSHSAMSGTAEQPDAFLVIIAESVRDPRHFEGHLVEHSYPRAGRGLHRAPRPAWRHAHRGRARPGWLLNWMA